MAHGTINTDSVPGGIGVIFASLRSADNEGKFATRKSCSANSLAGIDPTVWESDAPPVFNKFVKHTDSHGIECDSSYGC